MAREIDRTFDQQVRWAARNSKPVRGDGKAFAQRRDGLFMPLDAETERQLRDAPGGELTRLHSLRSSTALALNVFLPWKTSPSGIASVLGRTGAYEAIGFERAYPTGASPRHPHLDVVIEGESQRPIAIESKFLEIYDDPEPQVVQTSYSDAAPLWLGLEPMLSLVRAMQNGSDSVSRLGTAQLIKHALGLSKRYGTRRFELFYIWYEIDGESAVRHLQELARFSEAIGDSVDFTALNTRTYSRD